LILGGKSRVKEHYDDFMEALILRLSQRNYSRALALGTDENGIFYGYLPTTSPQGRETEGSRGKKWGSSGLPVTGAVNLVYFGLESQCRPAIAQVSRRIFGSLGIAEVKFLGHRHRLQKQSQIIAPTGHGICP
jgi:hypothetical protein